MSLQFSRSIVLQKENIQITLVSDSDYNVHHEIRIIRISRVTVWMAAFHEHLYLDSLSDKVGYTRFSIVTVMWIRND